MDWFAYLILYLLLYTRSKRSGRAVQPRKDLFWSHQTSSGFHRPGHLVGETLLVVSRSTSSRQSNTTIMILESAQTISQSQLVVRPKKPDTKTSKSCVRNILSLKHGARCMDMWTGGKQSRSELNTPKFY